MYRTTASSLPSAHRGGTGTDIYRVLIVGLSGTPMPSFADSMTIEDAWDLVHFIQSLSPGYAENLLGTTTIASVGSGQ